MAFPADRRRDLCIELDRAVIVDDYGIKLPLQASALVWVGLYSVEDIAKWDEIVTLSDEEPQRILECLHSC